MGLLACLKEKKLLAINLLKNSTSPIHQSDFMLAIASSKLFSTGKVIFAGAAQRAPIDDSDTPSSISAMSPVPPLIWLHFLFLLPPSLQFNILIQSYQKLSNWPQNCLFKANNRLRAKQLPQHWNPRERFYQLCKDYLEIRRASGFNCTFFITSFMRKSFIF